MPTPMLTYSGGQHPEWDEELRFPIYEDVDDMLAASVSKPLPGEPGVVTPQSMASKARKTGPRKGGKAMKVAVWADDIKEPELIGECVVNFDDALTKGEVDGELEPAFGISADDQTGGRCSRRMERTSTAARSTWS